MIIVIIAGLQPQAEELPEASGAAWGRPSPSASRGDCGPADTLRQLKTQEDREELKKKMFTRNVHL